MMPMSVVRSAVAGLFVLATVTGAAAQSELPPEVRLDMAIVQLERAVTAEDHEATLRAIAELRDIDPAAAIGDLLYFEAVAALALGRLEEAHAAITTFLSEVGRDSANYDSGLGVALEIQRAGVAEETYRIALTHRFGATKEAPRDIEEAVRLYRQAAALGHVGAMLDLGMVYDSGDQLERDYAEAAYWYSKAAAQGDSNALFRLGVLNYHGRGVPRDLGEAHKLFRKVTETPFEEYARIYIGVMHLRGEAVARDSAEAARLITPFAAENNIWFNDLLVRALGLTAEEALEIGVDLKALKLPDGG